MQKGSDPIHKSEKSMTESSLSSIFDTIDNIVKKGNTQYEKQRINSL